MRRNKAGQECGSSAKAYTLVVAAVTCKGMQKHSETPQQNKRAVLCHHPFDVQQIDLETSVHTFPFQHHGSSSKPSWLSMAPPSVKALQRHPPALTILSLVPVCPVPENRARQLPTAALAANCSPCTNTRALRKPHHLSCQHAASLHPSANVACKILITSLCNWQILHYSSTSSRPHWQALHDHSFDGWCNC